MPRPYNDVESQAILRRGLTYKGRVVCTRDVRTLAVDPLYQREFSAQKADRIAREFNVDWLGIVEVAERQSGKQMATDGQHRKGGIEKRMELGLPVDPFVLCNVKKVTNKAQEADMYLGNNGRKSTPSGNQLVRAMLHQSKGNAAKSASAAMEKVGLQFAFNKAGRIPQSDVQGNGVRGAAKIMAAYKRSPIHFASACYVLAKSYKKYGGFEPRAMTGEFLGGILELLLTQVNTDDNRPLSKTAMGKFVAHLRHTSGATVDSIIKGTHKDHSGKRPKLIGVELAKYCQTTPRLQLANVA